MEAVYKAEMIFYILIAVIFQSHIMRMYSNQIGNILFSQMMLIYIDVLSTKVQDNVETFLMIGLYIAIVLWLKERK